MNYIPHKKRIAAAKGFSLVEVTIALGIVSYTLLGLLGLFVVGLNSSRESTIDTVMAQIALQVSSSYNPSVRVYDQAYTYEGSLLQNPNDPSAHFKVNVKGEPHDPNPTPVESGSGSYDTLVPDAGSNFHLITLSITSVTNGTTAKRIQTSAYVP